MVICYDISLGVNNILNKSDQSYHYQLDSYSQSIPLKFSTKFF